MPVKKMDGKPKGSVFARKTSKGVKKLYYKSPYTKYKSVSSGLNDTPRNRNLIWKKLGTLQLEYEYGVPNGISSSKTIYQCFDEFTKYQKEIKNRQQSTIDNYRFGFNHIFKNDFPVDQSEQRKYGNYFRIEREVQNFAKNPGNLTPNSVAIYLRGIRRFVNWLAKNRYISHIDINEYIPETTKKEILTYKDSEMDSIINYFEDENRTDIIELLEFINNTGSRVGEALKLTWENVNFEKRYISFPNKVKRHIYNKIPMTSKVYKLLLKIKEDSSLRRVNTEKVFHWKHSSKSYLHKKINQALDFLNLKKERSCFHPIRKTFITRIEKNGSSTLDIKRLARHSDIRTTEEHYLERELDDLRKLIENAPRLHQKNSKMSQDETS